MSALSHPWLIPLLFCVSMHFPTRAACNPLQGKLEGIFSGISNKDSAATSTGFQSVPIVRPPVPLSTDILQQPREVSPIEGVAVQQPGDVSPMEGIPTEPPGDLAFASSSESAVQPADFVGLPRENSAENLGQDSIPSTLQGSTEDGASFAVPPRSLPLNADPFTSNDSPFIGGAPLRSEVHAQDLQRFARWSEDQLEPFLPEVVGQALGITFAGVAKGLDGLSGGHLGRAARNLQEMIDDKVMWVKSQPEVIMWTLQPGDHLRVRGVAGLMALTHHALYVGNGRIMHFTGGVTDKVNATCKVDSLRALHNYGRGKNVRMEIVEHPEDALPRDIIVARALSRVGETGYNLFSNNCEHLVYWCITGKTSSQQVERFLSDPLGLGREILHRQAEVGQPLGLATVAKTLLPPSLLHPVDMLRQQKEVIEQFFQRRFQKPPEAPTPAPSPQNPLEKATTWLQERLPRPLPSFPLRPAPV
eukprot:CAMPEP_0181336728 /NCGR_PEP_ID=MMETSP1101-20121128/27589_1 /TAXON_ID=46948 /ORGANISM="Rhodomonas abbreviata, Strain Caron Lab Isolate" /LENGTH=474 /DNA_ID=CAMNT_0023447073 /DNA_START=207 /DNA_END=1631 /DNA_ORIENTATION=-